jgi:hypothetical protein
MSIQSSRDTAESIWKTLRTFGGCRRRRRMIGMRVTQSLLHSVLNCCKIAIALIWAEKGEAKAQACDKAWFRQLGDNGGRAEPVAASSTGKEAER